MNRRWCPDGLGVQCIGIFRERLLEQVAERVDNAFGRLFHRFDTLTDGISLWGCPGDKGEGDGVGIETGGCCQGMFVDPLPL
jgi:hypothetical protein